MNIEFFYNAEYIDNSSCAIDVDYDDIESIVHYNKETGEMKVSRLFDIVQEDDTVTNIEKNWNSVCKKFNNICSLSNIDFNSEWEKSGLSKEVFILKLFNLGLQVYPPRSYIKSILDELGYSSINQPNVFVELPDKSKIFILCGSVGYSKSDQDRLQEIIPQWPLEEVVYIRTVSILHVKKDADLTDLRSWIDGYDLTFDDIRDHSEIHDRTLCVTPANVDKIWKEAKKKHPDMKKIRTMMNYHYDKNYYSE